MESEQTMRPGWQERSMLREAKAILLDWDGCVAVGNRLLPPARELIGRYIGRVAIVSNNSTHLPEDFEAILEREGVPVPGERIFLAGAEAVRLVAASGKRRIMMLCAERMEGYACEHGLKAVDDDPELVLLMRDVAFGYAKLEKAINALNAGAELVVANPDLTHPGVGGRVVPETGALLAALLAGCKAAPSRQTIIGKPEAALFLRACGQLGVAPEEAVMIGDNPDTDGQGARNAGMRSILICAGSPLRLESLVELPA